MCLYAQAKRCSIGLSQSRTLSPSFRLAGPPILWTNRAVHHASLDITHAPPRRLNPNRIRTPARSRACIMRRMPTSALSWQPIINARLERLLRRLLGLPSCSELPLHLLQSRRAPTALWSSGRDVDGGACQAARPVLSQISATRTRTAGTAHCSPCFEPTDVPRQRRRWSQVARTASRVIPIASTCAVVAQPIVVLCILLRRWLRQ
jgi:hypothetical protein